MPCDGKVDEYQRKRNGKTKGGANKENARAKPHDQRFGFGPRLSIERGAGISIGNVC